MITIHNLTKRYGDLVAVDDVSLDISRGQVVGLLGHNGAGKTTIMRMITGVLEPTSGTITVGGKDAVADRIAVQRMIGYLPENAPLYPEMLVQDYLTMMAELRGVPSARRHMAVVAAIEATGLHGHLVRPIGELSKGYRQRVGLAQAMVHEPEVLILDEPTNGLDPLQIETIRQLIRDLGQRTTVLLSTHILQEVEAVCDRVVVLIDGHLAADGSLEELLSRKVIRLAVTDATDVPADIGDLTGIVDIRHLGPDQASHGFELWEIDYSLDVPPIPSIIRTGTEAGWTIGSVTTQRSSLQSVFQDLQREQAERQKEATS